MSEATALALMEKAPPIKKPSRRDRDIYLLSRRGWTSEQLAVRYGSSEPVILSAIERYEVHKASLDVVEQDLLISDMTQRLMPNVEKVLAGAMKAETSINVGRGQKVIMRKVADHATRLKAVEAVKTYIETGRPKGGGIQINTQVNNSKGDGTPVVARGFDFEARLRDIRERKGLANDSVPIDGEFEDAEDVDVLGDELAEMGIDLEEDGDEDEDDFDEDNE